MSQMSPTQLPHNSPVTGTTNPIECIPFMDSASFRRYVNRLASGGSETRRHAVFVLHIDRLSAITRCGQDAERALLQHLGDVVRRSTGPDSTLGRLSTERFALIAWIRSRSALTDLAGALETSLQGRHFEWQGRHFRLGVNMGASILKSASTAPANPLQDATRACLAARAMGTSGVLVLKDTSDALGGILRECQWREHVREVLF